MGLLAQFDLQCRVMNPEPMLQRFHGLRHELVTGVAMRHNQMGSQCGFAGADSPDVEIVHASHSG